MRKALRWIRSVSSYVLVAAAAAWITYTVTKQFVPERSMPERAGFPRRLGGAEASDEQVYRFFYATTRGPGADLMAAVGEELAPRRSDELALGTFEARISPEIAVRTGEWTDPRALAVMPPRALDADGFYAAVKAAVDASPHRSVLLFVLGWKERWLTTAAKSAYLAYLLDVDTPVVAFDWPSNQGDDRKGYLAAQQLAHASGADLARLVEELVRRVRPETLWLVSLSLGGQVVCDAFDSMVESAELGDEEREIAQVVLCAPDVAQDEFDQKFAAQIRRLAQHLTVYVSSTDQALLLSHWLNRRARVGRTPMASPSDADEAQFALADRLLTLEAEGSHEIEVVDVTPINRHRNRHHFLTDEPEFLDELYRRLLRPDDPVGRLLYPMRTAAGVRFWILWDR